MSDNNTERDHTEALPAAGQPQSAEGARPERTGATPPAPATAPAGPRVGTTATAAPPAPGAMPPASSAPITEAARGAEPERVRGPYLAPVILGLVCLAIAGLAFAQEIGDWTIDWGNVGPLGIVAAGAVLVVLGALGLVVSRRQR